MKWPWSRRADVAEAAPCEVHDPAGIRSASDGEIDLAPTIAALEERVMDGRMSILRADCPLDRLLGVLYDERWLSVTIVLRCHGCGRAVELAASPRSSHAPYGVIEEDRISRIRFHDSPLLVDAAAGMPIALQSATPFGPGSPSADLRYDAPPSGLRGGDESDPA